MFSEEMLDQIEQMIMSGDWDNASLASQIVLQHLDAYNDAVAARRKRIEEQCPEEELMTRFRWDLK